MTGGGGGGVGGGGVCVCVLKKIVFDHVTFIKVKGQIQACRKIFPRLRYITAKYGLKPSNNKGDIQGRP